MGHLNDGPRSPARLFAPSVRWLLEGQLAFEPGLREGRVEWRSGLVEDLARRPDGLGGREE